MIDTLMALWNLGLKGRLARVLIGCLLICFSIALLLFTVGLPVFSSRSSIVSRGEGEGIVEHSVYATRLPVKQQEHSADGTPGESPPAGSALRCGSATTVTGTQATIAAPQNVPVTSAGTTRESSSGSSSSLKPPPRIIPTVTITSAMPTRLPAAPPRASLTPTPSLMVSPTVVPSITPVEASTPISGATETASPTAARSPTIAVRGSFVMTFIPAAMLLSFSATLNDTSRALGQKQHESGVGACLGAQLVMALPHRDMFAMGTLLAFIVGGALVGLLVFYGAFYVLWRGEKYRNKNV
jgi:hypothetical protein